MESIISDEIIRYETISRFGRFEGWFLPQVLEIQGIFHSEKRDSGTTERLINNFVAVTQ